MCWHLENKPINTNTGELVWLIWFLSAFPNETWLEVVYYESSSDLLVFIGLLNSWLCL